MIETRIPFLEPGRSRYLILNETPTWVYHRAAAGSALGGDAPETATKTTDKLDPTVTAGVARYEGLTKGGLFTLPYHYKKPMVVEAIDNPNTATITIVNPALGTSRAAPAVPFTVAAGEALKAVTMATGAVVGIYVREDVSTR